MVDRPYLLWRDLIRLPWTILLALVNWEVQGLEVLLEGSHQGKIENRKLWLLTVR